jgi:hypothetical protein
MNPPLEPPLPLLLAPLELASSPEADASLPSARSSELLLLPHPPVDVIRTIIPMAQLAIIISRIRTISYLQTAGKPSL